MTDHLKTLRAVVWLGDKATPGVWRPDDEADVVAPSRIVVLPDGEQVADWPVASCATGMRDETDEDANADFIAAAANARPALAALLRIVEAASKRLNQLDPLRAVIEIAERDGYLRALNPEVLARRLISEFEQQDALRAALRDLAPEVEDGE